jgi:hypothetical protein
VNKNPKKMRFFNECTTIEEVKNTYKTLAKMYHPDLGGDTATMQALNTEYAFACAKIAKGGGLTDEAVETEIIMSEAYRDAIEKIVHLEGIIIEAVGTWIWVTGNTRPVKDTLKGAKFFFASKKVAWYFRADEFKTRGSGKSLDQIKAKYGSETINKKYQKSLTK